MVNHLAFSTLTLPAIFLSVRLLAIYYFNKPQIKTWECSDLARTLTLLISIAVNLLLLRVVQPAKCKYIIIFGPLLSISYFPGVRPLKYNPTRQPHVRPREPCPCKNLFPLKKHFWHTDYTIETLQDLDMSP